MPKSKLVDFKAVKAAITMEQLLQHYGLLDQFKRRKDSLVGACPIHKGSNPTQFSINTTKNLWNCFSECKHGGNTLEFIAEMDDVSIHAAALKAIEWFHLDADTMSVSPGEDEEQQSEAPKSNKVASSKPASPRPAPVQENGTANKPLGFRLDKLQREHPYLINERGLTLETIVDFGTGYCDKGTMSGRIAIPIHNVKGELLGYAGRVPGEPTDDNPKYKLPPGFKKSLELFNIDRAIKEPAKKPLVIVKGFFGCMKIHQHGFCKVVALMGNTLSTVQEELIRNHTDRNSHVILMLNEDEAGQTGRDDIVTRLAKFCFVRAHVFAEPDMKPEQLSAADLREILEDTP